MSRHTIGPWTIPALVAMAMASTFGLPNAQAGAISKGITVGGGFKPGTGDPPYDYIFNVELNPGFEITSGDSFTILNLVGITPAGFAVPGLTPPYPGSLTSQPSAAPSVIWIPSITQTSTVGPYTSDVTWSFFGNAPIDNTMGSTAVSIGQFVVETSINLANPPYQNGDLITYDFTIGGVTTDGNTFPIVNLGSVPEPSSAILLLIGATAFPILRKYRKQRSSKAGNAC